MNKIFYIMAWLTLSAGIANAQPRKVVADKIVGIVGDKIVLQSDVNNAILDAKRMKRELPPDADCQIMQQSLAQKALVLQAEKDSIIVTDEDVDALLDNQIRNYIQQYGSKEVLEQVAGRTIYQIKEDFRQPFKENELGKKMRNKIVENVKVTPIEVKAFFDKIPADSLEYFESEVEVGEILMYPKANRELELYAMEQLNEFKKEVESGQKKFETLASLYSDDKMSGGGTLSMNRTEKNFDPSFVNASFRLKNGQISPVFKSRFGYHIVQMVNRNGDDATVRHILKIPQVTDDEVNQSVEKMDSVRNLLINNKIGFGEAVVKFSDDENGRFTAGMKLNPVDNGTYLAIDMLDKTIVTELPNLKPGEYSKPIVGKEPGTDKKVVRLIYLKNRTEPHRENLKDDYNRIAEKALEEKKMDVLEKWFDTKLPTYYIQVDSDYTHCDVLKPWYKNASSDK